MRSVIAGKIVSAWRRVWTAGQVETGIHITIGCELLVASPGRWRNFCSELVRRCQPRQLCLKFQLSVGKLNKLVPHTSGTRKYRPLVSHQINFSSSYGNFVCHGGNPLNWAGSVQWLRSFRSLACRANIRVFLSLTPSYLYKELNAYALRSEKGLVYRFTVNRQLSVLWQGVRENAELKRKNV